MRLPHPDAPYSDRVRYGRYVHARLVRAKRVTMAADVQSANAEVLQRGREWEDAAGPVQEARANRDAADDELDDVAQDCRAKLAGRSVDASRIAPYTSVFHAGIEYYTAAPLDQQSARYGELIQRLNENLPETDEVRVNAVPLLAAGITSFKNASDTVAQSLTAESMASTKLDSAEEAWEKLMTKVYGVLVADLGKKAADRFFPKIRSRKKSDTPE